MQVCDCMLAYAKFSRNIVDATQVVPMESPGLARTLLSRAADEIPKLSRECGLQGVSLEDRMDRLIENLRTTIFESRREFQEEAFALLNEVESALLDCAAGRDS